MICCGDRSSPSSDSTCAICCEPSAAENSLLRRSVVYVAIDTPFTPLRCATEYRRSKRSPRRGLGEQGRRHECQYNRFRAGLEGPAAAAECGVRVALVGGQKIGPTAAQLQARDLHERIRAGSHAPAARRIFERSSLSATRRFAAAAAQSHRCSRSNFFFIKMQCKPHISSYEYHSLPISPRVRASRTHCQSTLRRLALVARDVKFTLLIFENMAHCARFPIIRFHAVLPRAIRSSLVAAPELEIDKEENAKLGVYWLTKASEQGNLEATEMLRNCLATRREQSLNEKKFTVALSSVHIFVTYYSYFIVMIVRASLVVREPATVTSANRGWKLLYAQKLSRSCGERGKPRANYLRVFCSFCEKFVQTYASTRISTFSTSSQAPAFEVAKHLSEDSYGLIFGTNTFFALLLQSILTLIVVEKKGLALDIKSQYLVYGGYYIVLGIVFMIMNFFTIRYYCKKEKPMKIWVKSMESIVEP
ncbi:unnamed protein product [Trichogramma brassicae]|uniref:Uncharacterized protein n=1 Tax=Trichogramma brassicae TaxID=86971 RepID=A0A6H5I8D4_9HYME|nr:unnamed protein product [Trichogramma brassicae]